MEKFYFTFGSSRQFPYQNTYLVVAASDYRDAVQEFRKKYPDITPACMNCSDCYSDEEWKEAGKYYLNQKPAEVVWTGTCFGKKPEGFEDLFIFVPEMRQIIYIVEGSGDNLSSEDLEQGYVDYIYYEQYGLDAGMPEVDGGVLLLERMLRKQYDCLADCIPDVLDMVYGNSLVNCMILA